MIQNDADVIIYIAVQEIANQRRLKGSRVREFEGSRRGPQASRGKVGPVGHVWSSFAKAMDGKQAASWRKARLHRGKRRRATLTNGPERTRTNVATWVTLPTEQNAHPRAAGKGDAGAAKDDAARRCVILRCRDGNPGDSRCANLRRRRGTARSNIDQTVKTATNERSRY